MFMVYVDARKTNMKKKLHKHPKESHPLPHPTEVNTFDIMSFGAKGNGVSDDSEVIN
jgi:galacturan 1,4-alpha-galacturonidase